MEPADFQYPMNQFLPQLAFPQQIYTNNGGNSYQQDRCGQIQIGYTLQVSMFDGHGNEGHTAAQTALDIFTQYPTMSFPELFNLADRACCESLRGNMGGTTASVIRINMLTNAIEVANVGDSTVRIYDSNTGSGRAITLDHDTLNMPEFMRVKALHPHTRFIFNGGDRDVYVPIPGTIDYMINPLGGFSYCNTSRDWAAYLVTPFNNKLAMTRALGDIYYKPHGVISDPFVQTIAPPAPGIIRAVVTASDGLWDTLIDSEIREIVYRPELVGNADLASSTLLAKAIEKGRAIFGIMDNITLSVIYMSG